MDESLMLGNVGCQEKKGKHSSTRKHQRDEPRQLRPYQKTPSELKRCVCFVCNASHEEAWDPDVQRGCHIVCISTCLKQNCGG